MNIRIRLTKEEAIRIYRFLFECMPDVGVMFAPAGCSFMRDLLYPLTRNEYDGCEAGREWLFSAGGILWFLGAVKRESIRNKYVAKDVILNMVTRRLKNAYMALIDELVTDDPKIKYMDHDKQPGVDPFEGDDNV